MTGWSLYRYVADPRRRGRGSEILANGRAGGREQHVRRRARRESIVSLLSVPRSHLQTLLTGSPKLSRLDARSSLEFGAGSTQFCTENDFISDNTHVALHSVAQAAIAIACQCCTTDVCAGGQATIKGDSGLECITRVKSTSETCAGSFQPPSAKTVKDILKGVKNVLKVIQKVARVIAVAIEAPKG